MKVRIRIHANGKGLTLRYLFQNKPTPKEVLDLINNEYPGWSVIGFCEDEVVRDTVEAWAMKHSPEVDVSLIQIEDTQATLNGIPFAFIHQEEDTVRFFFYNYNFSWAVNHDAIKISR